jgi:capsular polysaccharide biosynthesis protein
VTAGDVYRALWRHKLFILALTAVCVAAAWYATSRQERTYEASALVRSQQRATDPGDSLAALEASERLARTYAEIIGSGALRGRINRLVADEGGSSGVELSADPVDDLGLLWISARSEDPARAALVANAATVALGEYSRADNLRDEIVVVRGAPTPSDPVSPNTGLNVTLALVLALIFNSGLVLFLEMFRDRLPETEQLEGELGYPVLATVPALRLRPVGGVDVTRNEDVLAVQRGRDGAASGMEGDRDRDIGRENG